MDEGMLLVYPELIAHGKLPYRDFETFYGPGNLWKLAGSYAVFGAQIRRGNGASVCSIACCWRAEFFSPCGAGA
jgi:hypothetical protein